MIAPGWAGVGSSPAAAITIPAFPDMSNALPPPAPPRCSPPSSRRTCRFARDAYHATRSSIPHRCAGHLMDTWADLGGVEAGTAGVRLPRGAPAASLDVRRLPRPKPGRGQQRALAGRQRHMIPDGVGRARLASSKFAVLTASSATSMPPARGRPYCCCRWAPERRSTPRAMAGQCSATERGVRYITWRTARTTGSPILRCAGRYGTAEPFRRQSARDERLPE